MVQALLLSNSTNYGQAFLEHAREEIADFLGSRKTVVFFPHALADHDSYVAKVQEALDGVCEVIGAHDVSATDLVSADAYFVGGGNTWRLSTLLHREGLAGLISRRVAEGASYIGSSAGTNVACLSIRTTNDMPILQPPSFRALGLIPFQINAHYIDAADTPTHMGETRETRIREFLEENDVPVLAMREGCWLRIESGTALLGGTRGARLFLRHKQPIEYHAGDRLDDLLRNRSIQFETQLK
jgi:dipeptidase E